MNANEIVCLGVDGKIYLVKRYLEIVCDNRGIPVFPVVYEKNNVPQVQFIAKFFSMHEAEKHPLRKAFFKFLAAKEHNIVEKQRPQDVTIIEARQMAEEALRISGIHKDEVDFALNAYWS
jgi:hypothetical protein